MKRLLLVSIAAALAAACATPAERAAQAQRQTEEMMQVYGPACERLGYKPDTDRWRDCVLRLNAQEVYERSRAYPSMTECYAYRGWYRHPFF